MDWMIKTLLKRKMFFSLSIDENKLFINNFLSHNFKYHKCQREINKNMREYICSLCGSKIFLVHNGNFLYIDYYANFKKKISCEELVMTKVLK